MSTIVKVIEVIGESEKSFDDAVRAAVKEAAQTVSGIKSVWVDNMSGVVELRIEPAPRPTTGSSSRASVTASLFSRTWSLRSTLIRFPTET